MVQNAAFHLTSNLIFCLIKRYFSHLVFHHRKKAEKKLQSLFWILVLYRTWRQPKNNQIFFFYFIRTVSCESSIVLPSSLSSPNTGKNGSFTSCYTFVPLTWHIFTMKFLFQGFSFQHNTWSFIFILLVCIKYIKFWTYYYKRQRLLCSIVEC